MAESQLDYLARGIGYRSYDHYLRGEHWTFFSSGMKDKKCFCCKYRRNLQVHHITYRNLGAELPPDVVTVCDRCHVEIHELTAAGTELDKAHLKLRAEKRKDQKKRAPVPRYVKIGGLTNKAIRQGYGELVQFIVEKGLIVDPKTPTELAFSSGMAAEIDGKVRWDLNLFAAMAAANRKIAKLESQGKRVPPVLRRVADPRPA